MSSQRRALEVELAQLQRLLSSQNTSSVTQPLHPHNFRPRSSHFRSHARLSYSSSSSSPSTASFAPTASQQHHRPPFNPNGSSSRFSLVKSKQPLVQGSSSITWRAHPTSAAVSATVSRTWKKAKTVAPVFPSSVSSGGSSNPASTLTTSKPILTSSVSMSSKSVLTSVIDSSSTVPQKTSNLKTSPTIPVSIIPISSSSSTASKSTTIKPRNSAKSRNLSTSKPLPITSKPLAITSKPIVTSSKPSKALTTSTDSLAATLLSTRIVSKHSIRKLPRSSVSDAQSTTSSPTGSKSGLSKSLPKFDPKYRLSKAEGGLKHSTPPTSRPNALRKQFSPPKKGSWKSIVKFDPRYKLSKKEGEEGKVLSPLTQFSRQTAFKKHLLHSKVFDVKYKYMSSKSLEIKEKALQRKRTLQMELLMKRRRVSGAISSSAHPRKSAIIQVEGSVYKVQKRKLTKVKTDTTAGSMIGSAIVVDSTSSPQITAKLKRHPSKYSSTRFRRRSHSDSSTKGPKSLTRFQGPYRKKKEDSTSATTTGKGSPSEAKKHCLFFSRFGKCAKIDSCPFVHDPSRVAVCTRFLRGTCSVTGCPFSHKVAPEKLPVCSFFLRGNCNRTPCPYPHVRVSDDAEVCPDFAKEGFCAEGSNCKKRHVVDCGQKYHVLCKLGKKCRSHGAVKQPRGGSKTNLMKPKPGIVTTNTSVKHEMVITLGESTEDEATEDEEVKLIHAGKRNEGGDKGMGGRTAVGSEFEGETSELDIRVVKTMEEGGDNDSLSTTKSKVEAIPMDAVRDAVQGVGSVETGSESQTESLDIRGNKVGDDSAVAAEDATVRDMDTFAIDEGVDAVVEGADAAVASQPKQVRSFVENFIALDAGVEEKMGVDGKQLQGNLDSRKEENQEFFNRLKGIKPRLVKDK